MKRLALGLLTALLTLLSIDCQNPSGGSAPPPTTSAATQRLPTEEDGAKVWKNTTKRESIWGDNSKTIELVSFTKTDGALKDNVYTMYATVQTRLKNVPAKLYKSDVSFQFTKTEKGWRGPDGNVY